MFMMKHLKNINNTEKDKAKRSNRQLCRFNFSISQFFNFSILLSAFVTAVSCSSIDCPLNNLVATNWQLLNPDGTEYTLTDTLTISTTRTDGQDSVLINRLTGKTGFSLPVSYSQAADVLFFEKKDTLGNITTDTVSVAKEDKPHFESVDCGPSFFHKLTGVSHTRHAIDSIVINYPDVNYDTSKKHLRVYFTPRN